MKIKNTALMILFICSLALISYRASHALFKDTATSTSNVFTASDVFFSPSPGEPTSTPTATPSPSPTATPSPTPTPTGGIPTVESGDVVINEINWGGSTISIADEWIELRNTKSYSIDITGWIIENLGTSGSPDITLPSGIILADGFYLISNYGKEGSRINIDPDFSTTAVHLDNDGEQLRLKTDIGELIDVANSSIDTWFKGVNSPPPKKSMERKDLPGDGTVADNWQDASTHTNMDGSGASDEFGTPKAQNGL